MTRVLIITHLLALVLLLGAGVAAVAAEPVALRDPIEVDSTTVTFGDVFDFDGAAADRVLVRAPDPGRRTSLSPEWLSKRARLNGIDWTNHERVRRVTIRRASQTVSVDALETLVSDALVDQHGGRWAVRLTRRVDHYAPASAVLAPRVDAISMNDATGVFAAEISFGPDLQPLTLNGRAEQAVRTQVLSRAITRGDVITARDVAWMNAPAGSVGDAPAELVGLEARRNLAAGKPLRASDLTAPTVIEKGEAVMVIYELGALRLTARGRALQNAARGQALRVMNVQSNRVLEARADGPGLARIEAASGFAVLGGS